ncbi:MAG TPA: alpha-glucosidase, partial [Rikenellaceae bacterium]|nr:alpha-glucosidase [Rikenellaceae bacterium]
ENLIFGQYECDQESIHASLYPYIRNTIGCMEFGGTFLNKRLERNNGKPDANGHARGTIRRTTDAFELATAVLLQNPIQNFAIAPNNLQDAPAAALDFLREVPTTWDDTRYIAGEPGKNVAIARRHGDTWYIGAVNASEEPFLVDIKALEAQFGGKASVLGTAKDGLSSIGNYKKPIKILANDGLVIVLK